MFLHALTFLLTLMTRVEDTLSNELLASFITFHEVTCNAHGIVVSELHIFLGFLDWSLLNVYYINKTIFVFFYIIQNCI